MAVDLISKVNRQVNTPPLDGVDKAVELYGSVKYTPTVWGSDSLSNFVDVLSIGPIGGVHGLTLDDTPYTIEEFPRSQFFSHSGDGQEAPWIGGYPYTERTISIGKNAEVIDGPDSNTLNSTTFTKSVSGLGVNAIKLNFTTSGFTHRDDQGRRKSARAQFKVEVIDENGTAITGYTGYREVYCWVTNPTAVQVSVFPPEGWTDRQWSYRVTMSIRCHYFNTPVSGSWTCSTVTELYKDTQTYDKIAFVSGQIVAQDVSGKIPTRLYLADGYKVRVPEFEMVGGKEVFTGFFKEETSNSHAWNAMAVITDALVFAGQPIDKINISSFLEFERYCAREVDGERSFSFSQYIVKATNYFKLASQIVGAADGKLYEDTSGRIGVLIDKQEDKRRIITNYDMVDEENKRTTVAASKRTNYVSGEFEDKTNGYANTILHEEDVDAQVLNGLISTELTLDTCTSPTEAQRVLKKFLSVSQVITTTHNLVLGHNNEDIQIGDILEIYDRHYSRINYCGKTADGSTTTVIQIDRNTPINLTGISFPEIAFDLGTGTQRASITGWTANSVTLNTPLPVAPQGFISFGVQSASSDGLKASLAKVLKVSDSDKGYTIECISYNDSLQAYVEGSGELIINTEQVIPENTIDDIQGLSVGKTAEGIKGTWLGGAGEEYVYQWRKDGSFLSNGTTPNDNTTIIFPLDFGNYELYVAKINEGLSGDFSKVSYQLSAGGDGSSNLPTPTNVGVLSDGTTSSIYKGRSFNIGWDYGVDPHKFIVRVTQGALKIETVVDGGTRSLSFSESVLSGKFGSDFSRSFTIRVLAVDESANVSPSGTRVVENPAPLPPAFTIEDTGDITMDTNTAPTDFTGCVAFVWESDDPNSGRPDDAVEVTSGSIGYLSVPDTAIPLQGVGYNFEVMWIDDFGRDGAPTTTKSMTFITGGKIPTIPELKSAIPLTTTGVTLQFAHDGTFLKKILASYRISGTTEWTTLSEVFNIPSTGSSNSYSLAEGLGYILVTGLVRNTPYDFKVVAANTASAYTEDSNIVTGSPYSDTVVSEIVDTLILETGSAIEDLNNSVIDTDNRLSEIKTKVDDTKDQVDAIGENLGDLKLEIKSEASRRIETDRALFNTTVSAVQLRQDLDNGLGGVTDAIFVVDPETGTITNRAFAYTDSSFSQASAIIDGVSAEVAIQASRVTTSELRITEAESSILLQAGVLDLKASYTEVAASIAGAVEAVLPAYTFGFFNSSEGWSAVSGSLTQGTGQLSLVVGDIENQSLNYDADSNPLITFTIERVGGTGWSGDLVVTTSSGEFWFTSVIADIAATGQPTVRTLNLGEEASYTGIVTGIRIILGEGGGDLFTLSNITIGKPSATLEALDGITSQVNQLGISLDAIDASLSSYVNTTFYDNNSVTFNNISTTLDGVDAIISLKASQQELDASGAIEKANNAAIWIDASDANITQVVNNYIAESGGINDQLDAVDVQFTNVQSEIDAATGLVRDQSISVNRAINKGKDVEKNAFYTAELQLRQQKNTLEIGESLATADRQLQAVTTAQSATAQEVLDLKSSVGSEVGQINSSIFTLNQTQAFLSTATTTRFIELNALVGDNTAEIVDVKQLVVDEGEARATAILDINTAIGDSDARVLANKEAISTETESRVAALDSLSTNLGDAISSSAETLLLAISTEEDARISAVSTLTTNVGDNTSAIIDNNNLITDESTARADAVSAITVRVSDNETDIISIKQAVVDENEARATSYDSLLTKIGDNESEITSVATSVTTETTARSDAITLLSSQVGEDIATVDRAAKSAIGYCTIGGVVSGHNTKTTCESSGGVWTNSPLAEAVTNVQVSSGGNTATVGSFFGAFSDLEGQVTGKAVMGVTTNGDFTGMEVIGGTSVSKISFKGDEFELKDTSGVSAMKYSAAAGEWVFTGRLVIGGYSVSSEADIRALDGKDGTDGKVGVSISATVSYNFIGTNDGWVANSSTIVNGTSSATYTTTGTDPNLIKNGLQIHGASDYLVTIRVRCTSGDITNNRVDIFYVTTSHGYSSSYLMRDSSASASFVQNEWITLTYDMRDLTNGGSDWEDSLITSIRLDLTNDTGSTFEIDHISVGRYGASVNGVDGAVGAVGAGFYGGTFSTISWVTATANSRFTALVNRSPVNLDIFTQTRSDGTASQARQYNGGSWTTVALQVDGTIVAKGTIAGDRLVAGTEITAPNIIGGKLATASGTGTRTEIYDDGTYLIWSGSGAKTDANGKFWVKNDGTGFVSGSFFSGQILESKFSSGTTTASVSHKSAGNDVEVTVTSNGTGYLVSSSPPSAVGTTTHTRTYTIKRGTTIVDSGIITVTRVVEYDPEGGGSYSTRDSYSYTTTYIDTTTSNATYTYSVTVQTMLLSSATQKTSIKTFENILG
jgi:predicted phage tail protein